MEVKGPEDEVEVGVGKGRDVDVGVKWLVQVDERYDSELCISVIVSPVPYPATWPSPVVCLMAS